MERHWIKMLIEFMEQELGFLIANKVSDTWIRPKGGIRQGDSLSLALFVLLTAILCLMMKRAMPRTEPMLYADDTLVWVPGEMQEIEQELRTLKRVMEQYAEVTGQRMHQGKSKVVLQGEWEHTPTNIEGFRGTWAYNWAGPRWKASMQRR